MSPGPYRELRVDLRWNSGSGVGQRISITVTGARQTFTTTTRPPERHLISRILDRLGTANPLVPGMPLLREINQAFLPQEMLELLADERRDSGRPLRLRLVIPGDEQHRKLRDIPWEVCTPGEWRDPGFTGMPTEFSRHSDLHLVRETGPGGSTRRSQHRLQGRVVIASAYGVGGVINGYPFEPLQPGHYPDSKAVEDELRRTALSPDRIRPDWPRQGICADELTRALAGGGVDAFYFAGHHGPGGLVVAGCGPDGDRSPAWLSAPDLARQLASAGTSVAVLMACRTAVAPTDGAQGDREQSQRARLAFAEELTAAGVPWVVSAQRDISNEESSRFAPIFFRSLAYGATVDEAAQMGCLAMGDHGGLIAVHTAEDSADPVAGRPPDLGRLDLAYRVACRPDRPSSASARLRRDPRYRVNPDLLWGLNRGPVRGVLVAAESALVLEERFDRVERIVQQGAVDCGRAQALQRRGWFAIQGSAYPAVTIEELRAGMSDWASWASCLEAAPGGTAVGLVLTWAPHADGDVRRVLDHLKAISSLLPEAAVVIRISCPPGDDLRFAAELSRELPGPLDVLASPDGAAPDADARLDALASDDLTSPGDGGGGDADALALAALRRQEPLGWRNVWKIVNSGASEPVRTIANYLAPRVGPERTPLEFLCESEPAVVAAAWRAGLRPDFVPAALPRGAALMAGSWALLARSRLTPEIVGWLFERGAPLASIPGLLPAPAYDQGHEKWLPPLRAAYRTVPPHG